jgi:hypothetical protein
VFKKLKTTIQKKVVTTAAKLKKTASKADSVRAKKAPKPALKSKAENYKDRKKV